MYLVPAFDSFDDVQDIQLLWVSAHSQSTGAQAFVTEQFFWSHQLLHIHEDKPQQTASTESLTVQTLQVLIDVQHSAGLLSVQLESSHQCNQVQFHL